jgi:hypothetical protein
MLLYIKLILSMKIFCVNFGRTRSESITDHEKHCWGSSLVKKCST